jgi:hypothetical protein
MSLHIKLQDCLWVHGYPAFHALSQPLCKEIQRRNIRAVQLSPEDPECFSRLGNLLRKTDDHVILHYLHPKEMRALYPYLKDRKNFSVLLVDWWLSPFWFTRNADYLLFYLYNGIAVRLHGRPFCGGYPPPLLSWPENTSKHHLMCSALRPAALLAHPFVDWQRKRLRAGDDTNAERLIYFPISFDSEHLPLREQPPAYDAANLGDTCGFWLTRDPYASARYNFVNLYADRKRLIDSILRFENNPFKVFDRRRSGWLNWETYCTVVRQSKFAVVTGGLQEASVPKFIEYTCLGTPMVGTPLPYEYPWLDQCLFEIDALHLTPQEVKIKLLDALDAQPRLRRNCIELRDRLLRQYAPSRILDMAQAQIDGQPIPSGYLKQDLKAAALQCTTPSERVKTAGGQQLA